MTWPGLNYTLLVVALGAGAIGLLSGALGSFAVLRRQSLLGDAISHAALPGIALAFLLTRGTEPLVLALGAVAAGWSAALVMLGISRTTRIKEDTSLGLVLSTFFGFGLLLLSYIQRHVPDAAQAGLDKLLFGQAAGLLLRDLVPWGILGGVALVVVLLLWKEFKVLSFDSDFAASMGYPVGGLSVLLTTLLVIAIVVGLQTVGVVLMSAMLVAPAAAARQWTERLGTMVLLAALLGAGGGVFGAVLSHATSLPTGPVIVLGLGLVVAGSLALAPKRGLLTAWLRERLQRRRLYLRAVLADLATLDRQHPEARRGHPIAVLRVMAGSRGDVTAALAELAELGWARQHEDGSWALTEAGRMAAQRQERERHVD